MYIQKAQIKNIRSIIDFEIEFPNPAGWHVLIGDNGAGKSTIIRSIALTLVGTAQANGLLLDWEDWLTKDKETAEISLNWLSDATIDRFILHNNTKSIDFKNDNIVVKTKFERSHGEISAENEIYINKEHIGSYSETHTWRGFYSVAYGPYRRFEGGNPDAEKLFKSQSYKELAAHMSIFSESIALTEPIDWLKELQYKSLEGDEDGKHTLENLKKLINSDDFLPHHATLEDISSEGVFFKDGNGVTILVNQMSDGYRSILSMTFELIRQLIRTCGTRQTFKHIEKGDMFIDLPGVVLVDEIDVHLHPTWQTRIGNWFLKYFPKLQFIVTTHSPLVCRAAEKGSIWRLAAPGREDVSGEVTGIDRERLIYGNILDAYGTEVFGENVSISQKSDEMLNRLAELNVKSMMGEIEESEHVEMENLKATLPTETK